MSPDVDFQIKLDTEINKFDSSKVKVSAFQIKTGFLRAKLLGIKAVGIMHWNTRRRHSFS